MTKERTASRTPATSGVNGPPTQFLTKMTTKTKKPPKTASKAKTHKVGATKKAIQPKKSGAEGKDTKGKAKVGRPTDFKAEYVEQGYKFALLGADDADLARMFDVSESTINLWKLKHPDFSESINKGKDQADAEVASKLFHRAKGYSHAAVKIVADAKTGAEHVSHFTEHYPPDTAAAIFWLKNRQREKWRDKIDHEHAGKGGGPIIIQATQTDERL